MWYFLTRQEVEDGSLSPELLSQIKIRKTIHYSVSGPGWICYFEDKPFMELSVRTPVSDEELRLMGIYEINPDTWGVGQWQEMTKA